MKPHIQTAAALAIKWSLGLAGGFILGPIVIGLASGIELNGKLVAEKLIVGVFSFPILFGIIFIWGALTKKNPITGSSLESINQSIAPPSTQADKTNKSEATGKPNKWNYAGVGAGIFMLLFLFLPEIIAGTLANQYYLGVAFWIGIIIYCSLNIFRSRQ